MPHKPRSAYLLPDAPRLTWMHWWKNSVDAFSVEHTNALDRAIVRNPLAETPSMGRSNRLGGGLTALDRRDVENQFTAPGGTPSGTVRLGLS
jgi:hypothetical protein